MDKGKVWLAIMLASIVVLAAIFVTVYMDEDPPPLEIEDMSPVGGTEDIDLYPVITISFSHAVSPSVLDDNVVMQPSMVGEWEQDGKNASFTVLSRLGSNTNYTMTIPKGISSKIGGTLHSDMSLSFTTGNTSYRTIENGTSAQLDYILMADDLMVSSSLQSVLDDDLTYPKSPYYVDDIRPRLAKLRRFPLIIGKEVEYAVMEEHVMGMKIGETRTFTLGPDEVFGSENASLFSTLPLNHSIPRTETISIGDASTSFGGNITPGAHGVHMSWGWNISLVSNDSSSVLIRHEPEQDMVSLAYGWETIVRSVNSTNISLQHIVSPDLVHEVYSIAGTYPERVFMVRQVNITGDYVVIDENWPPGIKDMETTWTITVYDIKYPGDLS